MTKSITIDDFTEAHKIGLLKLYNRGESLRSLAEKVGCSHQLIKNVLNSLADYQARGNARSGRSKAQAAQMAHVAHLTWLGFASKEIADKIGRSLGTVNHIKKLNREEALQ
jgi:transposase